MIELIPIDIAFWCLLGFVSLLGIFIAILIIWEGEE